MKQMMQSSGLIGLQHLLFFAALREARLPGATHPKDSLRLAEQSQALRP